MEHIPTCEVMADIGTDHGYLPVEAVRCGRVQRAVASDISKDSLSKAKVQIQKQGLKGQVEARLGSGLSVLGVDEADVVVIAGMGGNLIGEILERDYECKYKAKVPLLILQPIQFPDKLRAWLFQHGFAVVGEDLVKDEGIIYQLMSAVKVEQMDRRLPSEHWLEFGSINIAKGMPLLVELIEERIQNCRKILSALPQEAGERALIRRRELELKIRGYEELMKDVDGRAEKETG